jgi:hypothetical protein
MSALCVAGKQVAFTPVPPHIVLAWGLSRFALPDCACCAARVMGGCTLVSVPLLQMNIDQLFIGCSHSTRPRHRRRSRQQVRGSKLCCCSYLHPHPASNCTSFSLLA